MHQRRRAQQERRPATRTHRRYFAARVNLTLFRQSRKYLLCSAAHLPSCSSPAKLLPPAVPLEAHAEGLCRRHRLCNNY
jgi:hypothetical protein